MESATAIALPPRFVFCALFEDDEPSLGYDLLSLITIQIATKSFETLPNVYWENLNSSIILPLIIWSNENLFVLSKNSIFPPNAEKNSLQDSISTIYVDNEMGALGSFIHCSSSCVWAFFHAVFLAPRPRSGKVAMIDVEKACSLESSIQCLHHNDPKIEQFLDENMTLYAKGYQEVVFN